MRLIAYAAAALLVAVVLLAWRGRIEAALTDPEFWHSGTLEAVDACMRRPGAALVSADALRTLCASRHSRTSAYLDADLSSVAVPRATPASGATPISSVTLSLYNSSPDLIVTGATIAVSVRDGKDTVHATVKNLWIEPGARQAVDLTLDRPFSPGGAGVDANAGGEAKLVWYFTLVTAVRIGD